MHKLRNVFFSLCTVLFFYPNLLYSQTLCCEQPACKAAAQKLLADYVWLFPILGSYPEDPGMVGNILDSVRRYFPEQYQKIGQLVLRNAAMEDQEGFKDCFDAVQRESNLESQEDILYWRGYLRTYFIKSKGLRSPEFARGPGLHLYVHQGVIGAGNPAEAYAFTANGFLSYTFTRKGQPTGGRWRAMIGPAFYYSNRTAFLLANPRVEYRLSDIGSELLHIGCIKLIGEAQVNDTRLFAGGGIGAEIACFHLQAGALYETRQEVLQLQIGIGYQKIFRK